MASIFWEMPSFPRIISSGQDNTGENAHKKCAQGGCVCTETYFFGQRQASIYSWKSNKNF